MTIDAVRGRDLGGLFVANIVLVEDDRDVRLIVEHVLIDAGHRVDTAAAVESGCALVRRQRYDLVIADAKLPDGSGMDVADCAAATGAKALIITAYAFTLAAEMRERYEILLKPLRPAEIVDAVERALRD